MVELMESVMRERIRREDEMSVAGIRDVLGWPVIVFVSESTIGVRVDGRLVAHRSKWELDPPLMTWGPYERGVWLGYQLVDQWPGRDDG